jgi:hypothetical protein
MHSHVWATLLRQIPAEKHNNLMVVTSSGVEINLQMVLRLDAEYVAIKGRLAGSQDAGRVFFIPFNRIDYLGFQKEVKEAEFQEMFASLDQTPAAAQPPIDAPASGSSTEEAAAASPANGKSGQPIKSAVLDRFRSRGSSHGLPRTTSNPGTAVRPLGISSLGTNLRPSANG